MTPQVGGNTVFFTGPAAGTEILTGGFITIRDATGAAVTETFPPFTLNAQPTVSSLTANQWTAGKAGFNGTVTIFDGTAPFTVTSFQNLPTGLTPIISGTTLGFTGTPTVYRSFPNGSITVTDSGGATFTVSAGITINPGLVIATTSLPVVTDGVNYSTKIQSAGGTGADTFALTGGTLPAGLSINSNGKIAGTATGTGLFPINVTVTDAIGDHMSQNYTLAIGPASQRSAISSGKPSGP